MNRIMDHSAHKRGRHILPESSSVRDGCEGSGGGYARQMSDQRPPGGDGGVVVVVIC